MRILLCLLIGFSVASAHGDITLAFLESKPKGLARDFYIWQFLSNEQTSLEDALKAYNLIYRSNAKLDNLMSAKGKVSELPRRLHCQRLSFEALKKEDTACIKAGLNLASIPTMSPQDRAFLLKTFQNDASMRKRIEILSSKRILTSMLNSDAQTFAAIFNALSIKQKERIINQRIKPQSLKRLADENNRTFNLMLQKIIVTQDKSYEKFKKSLLGAKITHTDAYTLFMLGLNEAMHKKPKAALIYFQHSYARANNAMEKNRALFWQYYLSKDTKVLQQLSQSTSIDLYTIYANQKLNVAPSYEVVTDLGKLSSKKPDFDIKDPFQWQLLKDNLAQIKDDKDLQALSKHFAYEDTSAHLAYVLNIINKFKIHYFITPFSDKITWQSAHEKAFTYAIAKQESMLLPALISTSYALGMMQIMPFNVQPFARALKKDNITLEDMFNPITALEFGTYYLNDLTKEFKNPLFVSYAYNGGPGFLRRTLKTKTLFIKNRHYEPWLSMELIPYSESRDYGFRVLANYIVYQASFGNHINLEEHLKQTLIN